MEIVIRVDVLMLRLRKFGKRMHTILERLYTIGIVGAGITSAIYLLRCIFMWLAVA